METTAAQERMTISEVSGLLGIPVPTIRSWERRYAFPSPSRTGGRHRRYSRAEVESLRTVRDEITRGHPTRVAVALVRDARGAGSDRTEFLEAFTDGAARLDADDIRRSLDGAVDAIGVDRAIQEVAFPGMRRVGEAWRAGSCDVANEHLATEIVRRWLARLSGLAPPPYRRRPLVLAGAPKELHTIGLEAFGVVLGSRGWRCEVLGASTPSTSLLVTITSSRALGAVVTAQRSVGRRNAIEALDAVGSLPGIDAFYAGSAFTTVKSRDGVPGIYLGTDLIRAADLVAARLR